MSDNKNQAQLPLFKVTFEDGGHFVGGTSYFETKWLALPNKKIKRVLYKLPSNDFICLEKYDKYFHMVEVLRDITGKDRGKIRFQYAYIMGKRGNEVKSYRIKLFDKTNDKFRMGDITVRTFNINDSKIKGLNPDNWR